jgi:RNAse (barnase) inhibitor barstar
MGGKKEYVLEGSRIDSLERFYDEYAEHVIAPHMYFGRNLDAFRDTLKGGFGTPDDGFIIRWKDSEVSRGNLGYPATIRYLEQKLQWCHPENREFVKSEIEDAKHGVGPTVFDTLLRILAEAKELGVEVILE